MTDCRPGLLPKIFFVSTLLCFIISTTQADPQNYSAPIINTDSFTIQRFYTLPYNLWPSVTPGVSGQYSPPLKVFFLEDRLVLVSDQNLINLDQSGLPDEKTLISLFVSQTRHPQTGRWSPESGTLTFDGTWRGFTVPPLPSFVFSLNLSTGTVQHTPWSGFLPRRLKAAGPASVIIERDGAFEILHFQNGNVELSTPFESRTPISYLAASSVSGQVAYLNILNGRIHFLDEIRDRYWSRSSEPWQTAGISIPPGSFGMDFFGDTLVVAYPGKLLIITDPAQSEAQTFSHPDIPTHWYKVYGGLQRLAIHSPQSPNLIIISPSGLGLSPLSLEGTKFPILLKERAISAAQLLLRQSNQTQAFLLWLLPIVREQRALNPLDPDWPEIESQIQDSVQKLRNRHIQEEIQD